MLFRSLSLTSRHWMTFFVASLIYTAMAALSFVPLRLRWPRFTLQLASQIGVDIIGLTVLSYASGGIKNNIGLLLLVSLAAAGLISRGKTTLLFAALTSIAALLEHTYAVLYDNADMSQYVQVGLLCMAYFAVAWLAHTLAKYAVDSQKLAQRRGRDLVSLAEANRLVMRDMQDGVLVVDGQGMVMQMNARAERLLRKSVGMETPLSEAFPILFEQYALWKQTGSTSRDILQLDVGLQAKLRFIPIDRDALNGAVIFLEDMQRVLAEAQQIKLAALGRLTANIAHEVRNPLSAISYATELMQEERGDAKQQRLLQIVQDNTQRINKIVQDVMQLNRRDRAQLEVFKLETMLRTFVDEFNLAERLVPKAPQGFSHPEGAGNPLDDKSSVELTQPGVIALAGLTGIEVCFDRGQLRQVLWNLCGNALRYCRRLPGSLMLKISLEGGRVLLDVQDDGPGIPAVQQAKLFEPFSTTSSEGTGLGLYIAKELCEANDALLEYCTDGTGACFRITFGYGERDGGGI